MKFSIQVKNYGGQADNSKIWINEWEKRMAKKAQKCCNIGCGKVDNLVGGHIVKANGDPKEVYITPLCKSCNGLDPEEIYKVSVEDMMPL